MRRNIPSSSSLLLVLAVPFFSIVVVGGGEEEFTFNGFLGANLTLEGLAAVTSDGLLMLTNKTEQMTGHAFHPSPLYFRRRQYSDSDDGPVFSFSTTFVFGIVCEYAHLGGHGIAFLISPTKEFSDALPSQHLGLFNSSNNGDAANHVFAVELDTIYNSEFGDIDDNHVGIDIDSLRSNKSHTAGYFEDVNAAGSFKNLTLISGKAMQVWLDYDDRETTVNVTLSPAGMPKPSRPLLSSILNLSTVLSDGLMYVGFSSSTGSIVTSHYILGWSFKMNGVAPALDISKLPSLPRAKSRKSRALSIWLPSASAVLLLSMAAAVFVTLRTRNEFAELLEDWEVEYGPHRFSYKDLYRATKGFKEKELLGIGGFGRVYRGVLPASKMEVAVKRVSRESRQGMKEFVAEIVSIGHLRHRNLVQLLGYCRRKGELLLVYDFMPNGSLDKYLHDRDDRTKPNTALDWGQRFRIIKGVASGLLYLHEDWQRVVVHRDIKASNVLLDGEMNARLGDFGLARLYDRGSDPETTHVAGTMGYLAPELARTGKATTLTDVFAFGAFVLEVACGRRPVEQQASAAGLGGEDRLVLADWVAENWRRGSVLNTVDPRLGREYVGEEAELVLKLGLLCSHPLPGGRPSMRQVMQYLEGDAPPPELSPGLLSSDVLDEGFDGYVMSHPSTVATASTVSSLESLLR